MAHSSTGCTGSVVLASASGGGLRELPIMAEGKGGTGRSGKKKKRVGGDRECHTILQNQISQEFTHYHKDSTKEMVLNHS